VLFGLAARTGAGGAFIGRLGDILRRLGTAVPTWMTDAIERGAAWLQAWLS
jgi:hypothetical protein